MSDTKTRPAGLALIGWKPRVQNSLRGFADVKLSSGLIVHEIVVHAANGKAWANLPSKPMIGRDGQVMRDPTTGKPKYNPILEWTDRPTADRFSAAVIDLIEASHPGAVRS
ncbi:hypothetical protein JMJ56_16910 [Belnapia sp. T18]|uniref:Uncharacterized protein n=1 Tax=Belnapia arida TaxID=2804533 RepID=A0ABS1U4T7_9PROT|nr:hypothetical protein [Belnapia arida]MBL6079701.1 hypothetical protein [Belnapia arida]